MILVGKWRLVSPLTSCTNKFVHDKELPSNESFEENSPAIMANNYVNTYKPSRNTLHKHKIIKKLKNNKVILITKPDKGNEVIIVNRAI